MAKNIVFCADGTWNDPYQDENEDLCADPTNVYKLFLRLAGELSSMSLRDADEQEKILNRDGAVCQVAKYIHGVGDSRNPIIKLMGGAFGAGVISRIVRGYTFISRHYEPGDRIYIVGFSRGAYTARALGGLIANSGLLTAQLTSDRERSYRYGAEAWYRYRKIRPFSLTSLVEIAADLPAFLSRDSLKASDLVPVKSIAAVAVWDTVGAMGIPDYENGKNYDAFRFADTRLSDRIENGFHAVALDEQRATFTPTLWDNTPNVTQVLFPGAHADVGGGYPTTNAESGLSDGALEWMVDKLHLGGKGIIFSGQATSPDPSGTAHKPWQHKPWDLPVFPAKERTFPKGMPLDPSVMARKAAGDVIGDPDEPAAPYAPANLPQ